MGVADFIGNFKASRGGGGLSTKIFVGGGIAIAALAVTGFIILGGKPNEEQLIYQEMSNEELANVVTKDSKEQLDVCTSINESIYGSSYYDKIGYDSSIQKTINKNSDDTGVGTGYMYSLNLLYDNDHFPLISAGYGASQITYGSYYNEGDFESASFGFYLFSRYSSDLFTHNYDFVNNLFDELTNTDSFLDSDSIIYGSYAIDFFKPYAETNELGSSLQYYNEDIEGRTQKDGVIYEKYGDVTPDIIIESNPSVEMIEYAKENNIPMINIFHARDAGYSGNTSASVEVGVKSLTKNASGIVHTKSPDEYCMSDEYENIVKLQYTINALLNENIQILEEDKNKYFANITGSNARTNIKDNDGNYITVTDLLFTSINYIKPLIANYDSRGINVFDTNRNSHIKAAVEAGRRLREKVRYEELGWYHVNTNDGVTTNDLKDSFNDVFGAYFADNTIHYANPYNDAQSHLGSYSPDENLVQELGTTNVEREFELIETAEYVSTGIYVKAGEPVVIERLDDLDFDLTVRINMQRSGASKIFTPQRYKNGVKYGNSFYNRPYTDRSNTMLFKKGEKLTLSSPKGGPLYILVPGHEKNNPGAKVKIKASNVLEHPTISGNASKVEIAEFVDDVRTTPINWVDIYLPDLQIHTSTFKMKRALDNYDNDFEYYNENYTLPVEENLQTGAEYMLWQMREFTDKGFRKMNARRSNRYDEYSDGILDYCSAYGLDNIDGYNYCQDDYAHLEGVQHVNFDRATCGSGCSGNPVDTSLYVHMLEGVVMHEIGHGEDGNYFQMWGTGEYTPNLYYDHQIVAWSRAIQNDWIWINNISLRRHSAIYDFNKWVKSELDSGSMVADEDNLHPMWNGTPGGGHMTTFYWQLEYASEDYDYYSKIALYTRALGRYAKNETLFNQHKEMLGLSTFTYQEYKNIFGGKTADGRTNVNSKCDVAALKSSYASRKDNAEFVEFNGCYVTPRVKAQINANQQNPAFGYDPVDVPEGMYFITSMEKVKTSGTYYLQHTDYMNPANLHFCPATNPYLDDETWDGIDHTTHV